MERRRYIKIPIKTVIETVIAFPIEDDADVEETKEGLLDEISLADLFCLYGMEGDMVGVREEFLEEHDAHVDDLEYMPDHTITKDCITIVEE